jgi:hypothetical protein
MNFHVKYSSAGEGGCILTSNPFAGMPLISDIVPHDGDQDISVFVSTGAAFNFPVNEEFTMKVRNDKGEDELKKLKVVINSFSLTNNKTGQVYGASMDVNGNNFTVQNGGQINASSHNAWLYGWAKTLDPQSPFTVSVVADGYEWNLEGGWKKIDAATDIKRAIAFNHFPNRGRSLPVIRSRISAISFQKIILTVISILNWLRIVFRILRPKKVDPRNCYLLLK